jgi:SAM-dependent methyltransferase
MNSNKLNQELKSFEKIWEGGYFTGYSKTRNQKGIEEYLKSTLHGETLLEIGCGGGQWSKYILNQKIFKKIYCIDALSAQHNQFWDYMGSSAKSTIQYEHVKNFKLDFLKDESIDFVFSYDVFCHISYSGIQSYLESIYRVCKKNAKIFIMYADPSKYLKSEPENRYHVSRYLPKNKFIYRFSDNKLIFDALQDADGVPSEGRWYWIGEEKFTQLCSDIGFKIIENDLNIDKTNPITLFTKV